MIFSKKQRKEHKSHALSAHSSEGKRASVVSIGLKPLLWFLSCWCTLLVIYLSNVIDFVPSTDEYHFLQVEQKVADMYEKDPSRSGRDKLNLAIFYNTYVPVNATEKIPDPKRYAHRVITEQLKLRETDPYLSKTTLYFSQLGNMEYRFPKCDPCQKLVKAREGDEVITLQKLYEYCTNNPFHRVIYMHSKGTFNRGHGNRVLRRYLTKGIFSKECYDMPLDGTCDVCSSHFVTFPFHTVEGNMFVAECDYVSKLIPPKNFAQKKSAMLNKIWNLTDSDKDETFKIKNKKQQWGLDWQFRRESWVGLGRYAMEHWIHSHPTVRPCDVFDQKQGHTFIKENKVDLENVELKRQMAPRKKVNTNNIAKPKRQWEPDQMDKNGTHPWFQLPGRLYEWNALYGSAPQNTSWVYSHYTA